MSPTTDVYGLFDGRTTLQNFAERMKVLRRDVYGTFSRIGKECGYGSGQGIRAAALNGSLPTGSRLKRFERLCEKHRRRLAKGRAHGVPTEHRENAELSRPRKITEVTEQNLLMVTEVVMNQTGMSRADLAGILAIHPTTFSHWFESGRFPDGNGRAKDLLCSMYNAQAGAPSQLSLDEADKVRDPDLENDLDRLKEQFSQMAELAASAADLARDASERIRDL